MILFNFREPAYGWLSCFWPTPIRVRLGGPDGDFHTFPTAEHLYQYSKLAPGPVTGDRKDRLLGICRLSAAEARHFGRSFDLRPGWDAMRLRNMAAIQRLKFAQNPILLWDLRATAPQMLTHLAPWDRFWGVDEKGRGDNHLGRLIVEVRTELA